VASFDIFVDPECNAEVNVNKAKKMYQKGKNWFKTLRRKEDAGNIRNALEDLYEISESRKSKKSMYSHSNPSSFATLRLKKNEAEKENQIPETELTGLFTKKVSIDSPKTVRFDDKETIKASQFKKTRGKKDRVSIQTLLQSFNENK
jgi:hypothetical protein